jgi:hypothetical protein
MAKNTIKLFGNANPKSANIFVRIEGSNYIAYSATAYLTSQPFYSDTLVGLYRWYRKKWNKPIAIHVTDLGHACQLVDDLPNEVRYGRLEIHCDQELPPVPISQEDADDFALLADFNDDLDDTEVQIDRIQLRAGDWVPPTFGSFR